MKKILSLLLFSGIVSFSFAQSPYRPAGSTAKDDGNYTLPQNRNEQVYQQDRSAGEGYSYNNQQNRPSGNDRMYGESDNNRNTDHRGYEPARGDQRNGNRKNDDYRNDNRRNERVVDVRRDDHRYPQQQKSTKNNDLKAFGGGLILGGLLGVLIASSH